MLAGKMQTLGLWFSPPSPPSHARQGATPLLTTAAVSGYRGWMHQHCSNMQSTTRPCCYDSDSSDYYEDTFSLDHGQEAASINKVASAPWAKPSSKSSGNIKTLLLHAPSNSKSSLRTNTMSTCTLMKTSDNGASVISTISGRKSGTLLA